MADAQNAGTLVLCEVCRYRTVDYICGHDRLESMAPMPDSGLSTCGSFRIDRKGFGFCLTNPYPTATNVIMSQYHAESYSNRLCCNIECLQERVADLTFIHSGFEEEYKYAGRTLFNTPGLRHVLKQLPDQHKRVLDRWIFSVGPTLFHTIAASATTRDSCRQSVYMLQQIALHIPAESLHSAVRHTVEHLMYDVIEEMVEADLIRAKTPSDAILTSTSLIAEAVEAFTDDVLAPMKEASALAYNPRLYETVAESVKRWDKAKEWIQTVFHPDMEGSDLEIQTQRFFKQWGSAPYLNAGDRFVGAAAFYLAARRPSQNATTRAPQSELGYWEEFGTFDSIRTQLFQAHPPLDQPPQDVAPQDIQPQDIQPMQDEPMQDEPTQNEAPQDELIQDQPMQVEASQVEAPQDEPAADEPAEVEPASDEAAAEEAAAEEPAAEEPAADAGLRDDRAEFEAWSMLHGGATGLR